MGILNAILGRDDPPEEVIRDCKSQIRIMLKAFDLKEGKEWGETEDGFLYQRGSAVIRIQFVVDEDKISYVILHSPIVKLPPDNLLAFYRYLLELNYESAGQVSIGVDHDVVSVVAGRAIEGLTEEGLADVMLVIGGIADYFDDYLHEKFGAPFYEPEEEGERSGS